MRHGQNAVSPRVVSSSGSEYDEYAGGACTAHSARSGYTVRAADTARAADIVSPNDIARAVHTAREA